MEEFIFKLEPEPSEQIIIWGRFHIMSLDNFPTGNEVLRCGSPQNCCSISIIWCRWVNENRWSRSCRWARNSNKYCFYLRCLTGVCLSVTPRVVHCQLLLLLLLFFFFFSWSRPSSSASHLLRPCEAPCWQLTWHASNLYYHNPFCALLEGLHLLFEAASSFTPTHHINFNIK